MTTRFTKLAPQTFRQLEINGQRILKSSPPLLARTTTTPTPTRNASSATLALPTSLSAFRFRTSSDPNNNFALGLGVGGALLLAGLHSATGSANDFYDYRFKSNKDPDDLASFYGGEELMELFCVFPVVGQIMMRYAHFDETGNVITAGFPGQMKVSMVFSDETNDETGATDWFNKRERFRNTLFGYTCWDMVLNFGFRTLEDGTRECYHFGEYFHGNLPIVSQVMLLIFKVHARWVAWATEHHINHYAFTVSADTDDEDEDMESNEQELMEEHSRANMPLFLIKNYAWSDLMAMLFGYREDVSIEKQPSFLVTGRDSEEDDEVKNKGDDHGDIIQKNKLPFQQEAIQKQISEDIASDRQVMKELLARHETRSTEDVKAILVRRHTINLRNRRMATGKKLEDSNEEQEEEVVDVDDKVAPKATNDVYVLAKDLAVDRAMMRRLTRQRTRPTSTTPSPIKDELQAEEIDIAGR